VPSKKLEIPSLIHGTEIFIRVADGNTHDWGSYSNVTGFIPQ